MYQADEKDFDRMSEASFGSVISLHSVGSDGISYSPRPPSGRKKKTIDSKRSKGHKVSPYAQPVSPKVTLNQTKKPTGRELWVSAIRQGKGYSNESTGMDSWNGSRPNHAKSSPALHSASSFLIEQLLQSADGGTRKHMRTSSVGTARVGGNGPKYKQPEEYYDEILDLKKIVNGLKSDNDALKSKLVRLENENNLKTKRIEELLNPNKQTNDMRRTLTDKGKTQSSTVVNSLKHQQSALERSLKAREDELRKLRNDLKSTSIEEAKIQAEVYYQEVQRLKQAQADSAVKSSAQLTKDINAERTPEGKLKKMHEAIKILSDDKQKLIQENKSLKQDLAKSLEAHVNGVNFSKEVEDMSRTELLAKLSDLEQKLKQEEKKEEIEKDGTADEAGQIKLQGPLSQQIKQLREREKELVKENELLKEKVKRLKEDRSHYRKIADDLRNEVENVKTLPDDTASVSNFSCQQDQESKERVHGRQEDKSTKEIRRSKSFSLDQKMRLSDIQKNEAARKIQRNWRRRKVGASEDDGRMEEDEFEESVLDLQAAFRGHLARNAYYKSCCNTGDEETLRQDSVSDTDDIILIQSTFRGHLSRQSALSKVPRDNRSYRREQDRNRGNVSDEEHEIRPRTRSFRSRTTGSLVSLAETTEYDDKVNSIYGDEEEYLRKARLRYGSSAESNTTFDKSLVSQGNRKVSHTRRDDEDTTRYRNFKEEQGTIGTRNKPRGQFRKSQDYEDISVNHLKASSNPWAKEVGSGRSPSGRLDSEEDDSDVMVGPSRRRTDSKVERKAGPQASAQLAQRWAQSGTSSANNTNKLTPSSSRTAIFGDDDDDEDDDDDIVISPAISKRQPKNVEPKEELY